MTRLHTHRSGRLLGRLLLLTGMLAGLGLLTGRLAPSAHAAAATTITVSACDEAHLDAAVSQANADNAGDTITFSCSGDIALTSTLMITGNMALDGSGQSVTLDGGGSVRVLHVDSGGNLTLNTLTVAHGSAPGGNSGGGLWNDGGTVTISNSTFASNSTGFSGGGLENHAGMVSIANSAFTDNSAGNGGGLDNLGGTVNISNSTFTSNSAPTGGGLWNNGTATITNSAFTSNSASFSGGGGFWNDNGGTVNISNSTFASNSASFGGGGLDNHGGTVTIGASAFANNSASDLAAGQISSLGGGLYNDLGTVTISASTFTNNSVHGQLFGLGGGLYSNNTVNISNSTFANNSADSGITDGEGGGLWNNGTATISNSTFASNSASFSGGGLENVGALNIGGSIVANNTSLIGGNCYGADVTNPVTDQGYNLEYGTNCGFTGTGSLQNTDPQLDPNGLQNNGGPTQTIALQPGSQAIDQIPAASSLCPATDQRGDVRPNDSETACDMGAYESNYDDDLALTNVPGNITVDATSPQGAVVSYTPPTVVDEDSPLPTVSCDHPSGSTFAIGATTVTCTATDSDDTPSSVSASFTVTVNGAVAQLNALTNLVHSFGLPADLQAGFDTQLQAVQSDLTNNNTKQACNDLAAFSNHVQAQSGKHLTASQASQLLTAAAQIGAVIGCSAS